MEPAPQFGSPAPGLIYADRAAAFGICQRDGAIALVRVDTGQAAWLDLPGGGVDPGETPEQAVVREFGEETGLRISVGTAFLRADQTFINTSGTPFNNRGTFFDVTLVGEAPSLKIEEDHTLVWMGPEAAVAALRHDAHAWAVAAWRRRIAPGRVNL
jgi:8-oxo-dGTP diphosphatase